MDENAVLFLGAGASYGAKNYLGKGFPSSEVLANMLCPGESNLEQAAELYIDQKEEEGFDGRAELIKVLIPEFRCKTYSPDQETLITLPWQRIYTTNYDDIVEFACKERSLGIKSVTTKDSVVNCNRNADLLCVHINGSINALNKESLYSDFKLSATSYNTDTFAKSEWAEFFRNDIESNACVIFIGFSMQKDLDIKRIIYENPKEKFIFIVGKNERENDIKIMKKYGDVYAIGLEGFIEEYKKIAQEYKPHKRYSSSFDFTNFRKIEKNQFVQAASAKAVRDFYVFGKYCKELLHKEGGTYKSIVKRSAVDKIVSDIKRGVKGIFIHSDIGNGKTEVLKQIYNELVDIYDIFEIVGNNACIYKEIEVICSDTKKKIIVIEDFFNYYNAFSALQRYNQYDNITFIFTSRSSIFLSRSESFIINPVKVYDLNSLDTIEQNNLARILTLYGFLPRSQRNIKEYIKGDCSKKLSSVVLSIFDHSEISRNILEGIEKIEKEDKEAFRILLFLIISRTMSLDLSLRETLKLLDISTYTYDFRKNKLVNEFIDWSDGNAKIKSAVLSMWILQKLNYSKQVFDLLVFAAKTADTYFAVNKLYTAFLGNIISFKHLRFVLKQFQMSKEEQLLIINQFYESIKELKYYNGKYYFWLQYAMSSIELEDYVSAELHLNTAYSYLDKEMTPFEIDNQYARLITQKALLFDEIAIDTIIKIDSLLKPTNLKSDEKFYCFSMAERCFRELFVKFYSRMNENDKKIFKNIIKKKYNESFAYSQKVRSDLHGDMRPITFGLLNIYLVSDEAVFIPNAISEKYFEGFVEKDGQTYSAKMPKGNENIVLGDGISVNIVKYDKMGKFYWVESKN